MISGLFLLSIIANNAFIFLTAVGFVKAQISVLVKKNNMEVAAQISQSIQLLCKQTQFQHNKQVCEYCMYSVQEKLMYLQPDAMTIKELNIAIAFHQDQLNVFI